MVKAVYVPPLRAGALSRLVAGTRTFSPLCDATAFKAVVVHSNTPSPRFACLLLPQDAFQLFLDRRVIFERRQPLGGIDDDLAFGGAHAVEFALGLRTGE